MQSHAVAVIRVASHEVQYFTRAKIKSAKMLNNLIALMEFNHQG